MDFVSRFRRRVAITGIMLRDSLAPCRCCRWVSLLTTRFGVWFCAWYVSGIADVCFFVAAYLTSHFSFQVIKRVIVDFKTPFFLLL